MSDQRYARIKEVLLAVRELPAPERDAFLEQACAGDPVLRTEVESLLAFGDAPASILHSGALGDQVGRAVSNLAAHRPPEQIGRYRLCELLGEGGMGVVYRAEQTDPVHRVVALKLIRAGNGFRGFVRRFEAERQILARLDHPGIARLIDGGITDDGLPWFTMEYVEGLPLNRFCDQGALPIPERLRLFRAVCAAVQFAHRNLVVHRDLKPSNILVTADGDVKLLDFGIAKVVGEELDDGSTPALTRTEARLLTPEYAAPEQIKDEPVTTATDVYSLGVILYELLSGLRPHAAAGGTPRELEHQVLTGEPAPPSAAERQLGGSASPTSGLPTPRDRAAARGTDVQRLRRKLTGDLDTICLKALRKEPERRYASAEQLDEDLRRHLEGLPVLARRDSLRYRAGKFTRRHRGAVISAGAIVLLLASVITAYTVRLRHERDLARDARDESEAVTQFLSGMLSAPDPRERGRDVTVATVLDTAAAAIGASFADKPAIAARLQQAVGQAYYGLGRYDQAQRHLEQAVGLQEQVRGPDSREAIAARSLLVPLYTDQGRFAAAESLTLRILEGRRRLLGDEHPQTLEATNALADLQARQGHFAAAESLLVQTLRKRRRVVGAQHEQTLNTTGLLANLYADQSRFAEAEPLYQQVVAARRKLQGDEHPHTLSVVNNLALLYMQTGRGRLAEPLYEQTLAIRRRVLGDEHPETVGTMYNLAALYSDVGRFEESEALFLTVLRAWQRDFGVDNPRTLIVTNNLARLYAKAGRLPEARALYRQTLEARERVLGPEHPSTLGTRVNLAGVLRDEGRYADAQREYLAVIQTQRRVLGDQHANTLNTVFNLGLLHQRQGAFARAVPLLREAADGVKATLGDAHPDWSRYCTALGECLTALCQLAEADTVLRAARGSAARSLEADDPQIVEIDRALATLRVAQARR